MGRLGGAEIVIILAGLAFLVVAIAVVFFVVLGRRSGGGRSVSAESRDPLDILEQRYARGEISREEYQTMRDDLKR